MKKESQIKGSNLLNSWDESSLTEFVSKHWSKLASGLIALIALVFISQYFLSKKTESSTKDLFSANHTYEIYQSGQIPSQEDLQIVINVLDKNPELHSKFDGLVAQTFIYQENAAQALVYGRQNLARIQKNQPSPYVMFAEGSLLIAQDQYKEALESSLQLNNYFVSEPNTEYPFLRISNLLRIAVLSQQLQELKQELDAWNELNEFSNNEANQVVFEHVNSLFQQGQISLKDYIQKRLKEVSL